MEHDKDVFVAMLLAKLVETARVSGEQGVALESACIEKERAIYVSEEQQERANALQAMLDERSAEVTQLSDLVELLRGDLAAADRTVRAAIANENMYRARCESVEIQLNNAHVPPIEWDDFADYLVTRYLRTTGAKLVPVLVGPGQFSDIPAIELPATAASNDQGKLGLIKQFRSRAGCDLRAAKDNVEAAMTRAFRPQSALRVEPQSAESVEPQTPAPLTLPSR